jgi:hypothetical protein
VTIDGVSFRASPYTPEFMNWAFMYPRGAAARYWDQIPYGLDVLITHGPPFGILDRFRRLQRQPPPLRNRFHCLSRGRTLQPLPALSSNAIARQKRSPAQSI